MCASHFYRLSFSREMKLGFAFFDNTGTRLYG